MNFYAVLVIYVSHDVIARYGVAACWEDVLRDILLIDNDRLLLIKALANNKQFGLLTLLIIALLEKRHKLAPTAILIGFTFTQFV